MGDGVLDEAAAFFEFFAVVRGLRSEDAVFELFWFVEVIVYPYLGRDRQVKTR